MTLPVVRFFLSSNFVPFSTYFILLLAHNKMTEQTSDDISVVGNNTNAPLNTHLRLKLLLHYIAETALFRCLPSQKVTTCRITTDTKALNECPSLERQDSEAPSPTESLSGLESWPRRPKNDQTRQAVSSSPEDDTSTLKAAEFEPGEALDQSDTAQVSSAKEGSSQVKENPPRSSVLSTILKFIFLVFIGIIMAAVIHDLYIYSLATRNHWNSPDRLSVHPNNYVHLGRIRSFKHTSASGQTWRVRADVGCWDKPLETDATSKDVSECIEKCEAKTWCDGANFINDFINEIPSYGFSCEMMGGGLERTDGRSRYD